MVVGHHHAHTLKRLGEGESPPLPATTKLCLAAPHGGGEEGGAWEEEVGGRAARVPPRRLPGGAREEAIYRGVFFTSIDFDIQINISWLSCCSRVMEIGRAHV